MFRKLKNVYHFLTAWVFHIVYGLPARNLKIIGITGTDGKTTTSSFVHHVLKTAGKHSSLISSVGAYIGGTEIDTGFHVTTPDPQDIPRYLSKSSKAGDEYFVLEITSHGLDQHRAAGIRFEISGITNITHEHLGYHKTFDAYVKAKSKIIRLSKRTILNADQKDMYEKMRLDNPKSLILTFGLKDKADYSIDIATKFEIYLEDYNKYNFLLAYAICHELGITDEVFSKACKTFTFPPGRMEELYNKEFTVISDFAHTPNALDNALSAGLKKYPSRSRLIHVFGAAAFRDDSKRSLMGMVSGTYANIVILTEEDYRTEDPERIFAMISEGLEEKGFSEVHPSTNSEALPIGKCYMKILDREEAIRKALSIALPGDLIMITGKGQEKSLCRANKEYPYDEKKCVKKTLQNRVP